MAEAVFGAWGSQKGWMRKDWVARSHLFRWQNRKRLGAFQCGHRGKFHDDRCHLVGRWAKNEGRVG